MSFGRALSAFGWIFAVAALATAPGCSCGSDSGSNNGDSSTDADPAHCVAMGDVCVTTAECCGGRLCEVGDDSVRRCSESTFCRAGGEECTQASQCCSLSCNGTCQDDGSLCSQVGDECGGNVECCSNRCDGTCQSLGGGCTGIGEACTAQGPHENCCSKYCSNFGTDDNPDLRCARSSACGARGEACAVPADCCSGVCQDGRCPTQNQIGGSRFAGEPCINDADCSSYLCATEVPGGPKICQYLGGCRPNGELCTEDWQCCSDIHYTGQLCPDGPPAEGNGCVDHSGVDGLAWCSNNHAQTGPKEPGELCGDSAGGAVHMCCFECEETPLGVSRCSGGGEVCVGDGGPCRLSSDCCTNICSPFLNEDTGETELRCGQCVTAGGQCTTHGDCCDFVCTDGVCGGTTGCIPSGVSCTASDVCCDDLATCWEGRCQRLG
jgi:hypothetical protein